MPRLQPICIGLIAVLLFSVRAQTAPPQTAAIETQKPLFSIMHSFAGQEGTNPTTTLTLGKDNALYGTTGNGGSGGHGTVFKMTLQGQFTVLHSFTGHEDGSSPLGKLSIAGDGTLYGCTRIGGRNDSGTLWKVSPSGKFTTVYAFAPFSDEGDNLAGGWPESAPVPGQDGFLYGMATGGAGRSGVIYRFAPNGTYQVVYALRVPGGYGGGGRLTQGKDEAFYGANPSGGARDNGTLFRVTPDGQYGVIYAFAPTEGKNALVKVTPGPDGAWYGLMEHGGTADQGTIYKVTAQGQFTTVHTFQGGTDGGFPWSGLTARRDGFLFGTTRGTIGSFLDAGTIFCVAPDGTFTNVFHFGQDVQALNPFGGVIFGPDGTLYGTTNKGGASGNGTIYKLTLP